MENLAHLSLARKPVVFHGNTGKGKWSSNPSSAYCNVAIKLKFTVSMLKHRFDNLPNNSLLPNRSPTTGSVPKPSWKQPERSGGTSMGDESKTYRPSFRNTANEIGEGVQQKPKNKFSITASKGQH